MLQQNDDTIIDPSQYNLTELGYKIFLDRYALKTTRDQIDEGDTVIVIMDNNNDMKQKREIGTVIKINRDESLAIVQLMNGETVDTRIELLDKPLETDPKQMHKRVARGIASVEAPDDQLYWQEKFEWLLDDWKFVPGGRVLTMAGTEQDLTCYNCFVIDSPKDSRGGIMEALTTMAEIMSRGGGVGINVSTLRPRHAYVKGVNGRSSGSVSWAALYSYVTGLIEQSGCLYKTSNIPTKQGWMSVDKIVSRFKKGEKLETWTHKGWKQVTDVFENGIKAVYRLKTKQGYFVDATANHPIVRLNKELNSTELTNLSDIQPGDTLLVLKGGRQETDFIPLDTSIQKRSKHSKDPKVTQMPEYLDDNLAYIIGYFIGNGSTINGRNGAEGFKLEINKSFKYDIKYLTRLLHKLFPEAHIGVQEHPDRNWVSLRIYSTSIVDFMIKNQLTKRNSKTARVPMVIKQSGITVVKAFLAGYMAADGSFAGQPYAGSSSKKLIEDLQQLFLSVGIPSRRYETLKVVETKNGEHQEFTSYILSFPGKLAQEELREIVDGRCERADDFIPSSEERSWVWPTNLSAIGEHKYWRGIHNYKSNATSISAVAKASDKIEDDTLELLNACIPVEVESIESIGQFETFDITVEDVHLLSANGIYTSNSRRGALMLILNDWHPDVLEFIKSKTEMGRIVNANISVGLSDKFMDAVKQGAMWELKFPDTTFKAYNEEWSGNLEEWEAKGYPVTIYDAIPATDIWETIVQSAWASAEPGLWFRERTNKMSNSWYFNELISTNPCVTGDTLVSTSEGYVKAKDIEVGMKVMTPTGFKTVEKFYNNGKQRIYKVKFSDGDYLRGTLDHKLKVVRNKRYEWVAFGDLVKGDKVLITPNTNGFSGTKRLPEEAIRYLNKYEDNSKNVNVSEYYDKQIGRFVGIVLGDGTFRKVPSRNSYQYLLALAFGTNESEWEQFVYQELDKANMKYNRQLLEKEIVYPNGTSAVHASIKTNVYKLATLMAKIGLEPNVKAPNKEIPQHLFNNSKDFLAGLLDGLFSTDGSVTAKVDNPMLRLSTSSYELARQVRMILLQFGIQSRIYRSSRDKSLVYDGRSMYGTGEKFDVAIMNEGIKTFASEIGLSHPDKQKKLEQVVSDFHFIGATWTASVVEVEDTGIEEEVYDLYEPTHLTWITNGYTSFDCGEIALPGFGICNLGSINLSRFYDSKSHDVNWDLLAKVANVAVRFMDNVIDYTPYHIEKNKIVQKGERRLGLGIMGLAELFIKCGVRYGSPEGIALTDKIFETIATTAYNASIDLANQRGSFSNFNAEKHLQSGYMTNMPQEIRERVKNEGIRNVTILTIPPTGCVNPNTLISTGQGLRKIKELGNTEGKQWQDINMTVMTDDGQKEATKFYVNGKQKTIRVQTCRGFNIEATPNHQIRIIDKDGNYSWCRMDKLQYDDTVVLWRDSAVVSEPIALDHAGLSNHFNVKTVMPTHMSPEFAELLGLYMGDGYLKSSSGIHIMVNNADLNVIDRIRHLAKQLFNANIGVESRKGCKSVAIYSKNLNQLLKQNNIAKPKGNYGQGAQGAFIPDIILASGRECISAFLRGLFDADGSVSRDTVSLSTTSRILAEQTQVTLLGLNIASTRREIQKDENSYGNQPIFEVRVLNRDEVANFRDEIGFISDRKNEALREISPSSRGDTIKNKKALLGFYNETKGFSNKTRQLISGRVSNGSMNLTFVRELIEDEPEILKTSLASLIHKGAFFDTVDIIEDGECQTYDLSVPENNTYIANGFVSHNTTGTMVNTSTGIEPYFGWTWWRQGRLGLHEETVEFVQDFMTENNLDSYDQLPDYFVTAMELTPKEHVDMMAAAQRWIDNSISKTINCPNDWTPEQVNELYQYMYDSGCKGGTIYRDGSRDIQVLMTDKDKSVNSTLLNLNEDDTNSDIKMPIRPRELTGKTIKVKTPYGGMFITINEDPEGIPYEVFVTIGKSGSDLQAQAEAFGRLISTALQMQSINKRKNALRVIVKKIEGIGGSRPMGFGPNRIASLPDAIAKAINDHYLTDKDAIDKAEDAIDLTYNETNQWTASGFTVETTGDSTLSLNVNASHVTLSGADLCPECTNQTLVRIEGCKKCQVCGYSEC